MIKIKSTASGKGYVISKLERGYPQYMDRQYLLDYVPEELCGCVHIMTCGNDKMTPEDQSCLLLEADRPVNVYISPQP